MTNLKELLKPELENLINQNKEAIGEIKRVAVTQAWKMLQIVTAKIITLIENNAVDIVGQDKKKIAMEFLDKFYSSVFTIVDIPFVPSVLESIIHKYIKTFLMILLGSTIDALVTTFKDMGVFQHKEGTV